MHSEQLRAQHILQQWRAKMGLLDVKTAFVPDFYQLEAKQMKVLPIDHTFLPSCHLSGSQN
jgi:hypothetical protein